MIVMIVMIQDILVCHDDLSLKSVIIIHSSPTILLFTYTVKKIKKSLKQAILPLRII